MLRKIAEIKVPTGAGAREAKTEPVFASYDRQGAAFAFYFSDSIVAGTKANLLFMIDGQKVFVDDDVTLGETNETHTFTYPLPDELLNYTGKIDGYLYFDFEDGSHSDEIHFVFTIKKSKIDEETEEAPDVYIKSFEDVKAEVQEAADGAKETISQKVTEVSDTSDSAISKVNQVAKNADQAQGDIQTSVSDVQSRQAGAEKDIAGLVESTESARDEAIKTMNELDYSDINLLTGTSQNWKEETIDYWSVLPHDVPLERMGIKIGDTVTYSVEIDNTVDDINNTIDIKMFAYNSTRYKEIKGSSKSNEIKPGEIGVASTSLTIPEETDRLRLYIRREDSNGSKKIKYHKSKLQRGNLSTQWTPAPEDIGLKSELEQIKQAIINLGGSV
ncbi:MAG: phage baseplate upper protein [Tetragenococcus koreensis]|nr:phage baseplate upper protein [Tetragenococcus koreensis]